MSTLLKPGPANRVTASAFPFLPHAASWYAQFELALAQFVSRLSIMRRTLGAAADHRLLVDTRASGQLLSTTQGFSHFLSVALPIIIDVLKWPTCDQEDRNKLIKEVGKLENRDFGEEP